LNLYRNYYSTFRWQSNIAYVSNSLFYADNWNNYPSISYREYDYLNWFGYDNYYGRYYRGRSGGIKSAALPSSAAREEVYDIAEQEAAAPKAGKMKIEDSYVNYESKSNQSESISIQQQKEENNNQTNSINEISLRTNLQETAFFMPELKTNEQGEIIISFTAPEALSKWKILGLAHTKDLKYGIINKETITQKELMVTPNLPRFFREGDKLNLSIKINNLTQNDIQGQSELQILDAYTRESLDHLFSNKEKQKLFTAKKEQSASTFWSLSIPEGVYAVIVRTTAKSGKHTDGEETVIPVLTNRMLVTETLPLPIRGNQTKNFTFEKLVHQNNGSTTLQNHQFTLEFTANPVWYAIQALPYMMEYPYECAEQTFSRYYANSIVTHVANSHPKIKAVFDSWKIDSPEALLSNLEKNQELKSMILAET
ncbi:MAG: alpha-2-macroglobulin family protein, partial [Bacteroidia bacterium]